MRPSIWELLKQGHAALRARHSKEEETKIGTLRGGNAGAIIDGEIYGKCHRISYARSIGIGAPVSWERELMFAAGRTNEDSWYEVLKESWPGLILRESEVPVSWTTDSGMPVTGRPDFVLAQPDGTRVLGLELKLVSSFWTAVSIFIKKVPKTDHLIQAAHYSMALGIPFELWYSSRVDWPIIGWAAKQFESAVRWVSGWSEPSLGFGAKAAPNKIFPFYQGFELEWDDDVLGIRPVGSATWTPTSLTKSSITDYYNYVARMSETGLGPRPASKEVSPPGEAMGYSKCDAKYCSFSGICDRYENNADRWVEEATKTFGKGSGDYDV